MRDKRLKYEGRSAANGRRWPAVVVLAGLTTLAFGCETRESLMKRRIRDVERGLLRAVYLKGLKPAKLALDARMAFYRVPGVSLAVMNENRLEWARAYGVRDAVSPDQVTGETLFQAGELGQPVTAAAALRLVAAGSLDLDEDVNRRLVGWKVPENDFTAKAPVTLRDLLTQRAGFPSSRLPGFARDRRPPGLPDLLSGRDAPWVGPVQPLAVPGAEIRPSEIGYGVLAQLLSDATAEPLPAFMKELVLGPAGLTHSTFEVPLTDAESSAAASGHGRDGRPAEGGWLNYPGDGLWSTPSDLMSFAATLLAAARGEGAFLPPAEARSMLTAQSGNRSFGFIVEGDGTEVRFFLRGQTQGFTCSLDVFPYKGQGAVIMTNSDNGSYLSEEILRALSAVYGWPVFRPEEKTPYRLDPSLYGEYTGRYEVSPDYVLDVSHEDYYLVIRPTGQSPTKFYVENQTFFFSVDPYIRIQFLKDASGRVTGLVLWQQDFKQEARKIG